MNSRQVVLARKIAEEEGDKTEYGEEKEEEEEEEEVAEEGGRKAGGGRAHEEEGGKEKTEGAEMEEGTFDCRTLELGGDLVPEATAEGTAPPASL